jgi:hypothetical protein
LADACTHARQPLSLWVDADQTVGTPAHVVECADVRRDTRTPCDPRARPICLDKKNGGEPHRGDTRDGTYRPSRQSASKTRCAQRVANGCGNGNRTVALQHRPGQRGDMTRCENVRGNLLR